MNDATAIRQDTSLNAPAVIDHDQETGQGSGGTWMDIPTEAFKAGLDRRAANRAALVRWVRESLVEGSDFGKLHVVGKDKCRDGARCKNPAHFSKPSLFKPGAEKICGMLGVTARFPTLPEYEAAAVSGVDLQNIILRCELIDGIGRVVATGVGARSLKQDWGDLNKSLKMCEKSAFIDGTLRMAGLSEIFTQDIEDMKLIQDLGQDQAPKPSPPPQPAPQPRPAPSKISKPTPNPDRDPNYSKPVTQAQHRMLESIITQSGVPRERIRSYVINRFPDVYAAGMHFSSMWQGHMHHVLENIPRFKAKMDAEAKEEAAKAAANAAAAPTKDEEEELLKVAKIWGWRGDWERLLDTADLMQQTAIELAETARRADHLDQKELDGAHELGAQAKKLMAIADKHEAEVEREAIMNELAPEVDDVDVFSS